MTGFLLWCSFVLAALAVTAALAGGFGWAIGFAVAAAACFEPFRRSA